MLSNIDDVNRYEKLMPNIYEGNIEELKLNFDQETGESIGDKIPGNEDTLENYPDEQRSDRVTARSVFLGDSD
ncbi:hypothetical protein J6590_085598 [Homalodisca vitripennis]|nr:hypothetical protein J6590_085598 [Homalodisca vitripennis]